MELFKVKTELAPTQQFIIWLHEQPEGNNIYNYIESDLAKKIINTNNMSGISHNMIINFFNKFIVEDNWNYNQLYECLLMLVNERQTVCFHNVEKNKARIHLMEENNYVSGDEIFTDEDFE